MTGKMPLNATLAILMMLSIAACSTSPTGRSQLTLFPDSQIASMGTAAYQEMKQQTPISGDPGINAYVNCVTDAILAQVPGNTDWEVTVFDDEAVNAFALPGGKIGVYTGLLKVADGPDQLAAVIGHEIAHVIADHGNARISAQYAAQTGLQLAQVVAGAESAQKSQLWGLLGLGAQVGILLPYGRGQESEADVLGLRYMARAGFNPEASIQLWQNMGRQGGGAPPEFLSTHPSHATRINTLRNNMPEARSMYQQALSGGNRPQCNAARVN